MNECGLAKPMTVRLLKRQRALLKAYAQSVHTDESVIVRQAVALFLSHNYTDDSGNPTKGSE